MRENCRESGTEKESRLVVKKKNKKKSRPQKKIRHKIGGAKDSRGKIHRYGAKKEELKAYKREGRCRKEEETSQAELPLQTANRKCMEAQGDMHKRSLAESEIYDSPSLTFPQYSPKLGIIM